MNQDIARMQHAEHMQKIEAADHSRKNTVWKKDDDIELLKYFSTSKNNELIEHFKRPYKSLKLRYNYLIKSLKYDVNEEGGDIVLRIKLNKED